MIELVKLYRREEREKYEIIIFPSVSMIENKFAIIGILYIGNNTFTVPYMCNSFDEVITRMKSLDNPTEREEFFKLVEEQISTQNIKPDNEQPTEGTDT